MVFFYLVLPDIEMRYLLISSHETPLLLLLSSAYRSFLP